MQSDNGKAAGQRSPLISVAATTQEIWAMSTSPPSVIRFSATGNQWRETFRDISNASAIREEMIHAIQIITAKKKYDQGEWRKRRFQTAEIFYEDLLGAIIDELATKKEGKQAVLIAAQLYYEDWTINSMERLQETDRRLHGRDGYLAIELIRQLVQIRRGELTSEEARGNAWDKHRIIYVGNFGTTENLLKSMAETLRHSVPKLVTLSPTLAEALSEIEEVIQTIDETRTCRRGSQRPDTRLK
jgi:hypothetical protein